MYMVTLTFRHRQLYLRRCWEDFVLYYSILCTGICFLMPRGKVNVALGAEMEVPMFTLSRTLIKAIIWLGAGMVGIVLLHLGGSVCVTCWTNRAPYLLWCIYWWMLAFGGASFTKKEAMKKTEAWVGVEQLSWLLIGPLQVLFCGELVDSFTALLYLYRTKSTVSNLSRGYRLPSFPCCSPFVGLLLLPRPGTRTDVLSCSWIV